MPTITRLVAGKRNPSRVNVYLDGSFSFTLSAEEVIKRTLKFGLELTDEKVEELQGLGSQEKLFGKIINFLSYRPRSRRELTDRLKKYLKDHPDSDPVIASILARLEKLGYLDDHKFAAWFVESRQTSRPRSTRHLRSELFKKGIDKDIIDQILVGQDNDEQAIQALIKKKSSLPREKLIAYLARRGFSYDLIKKSLPN